MSRPRFEYVGHELGLFWDARNWKHYWASILRPYVTGDVLEVGAGLGANTGDLDNSSVRSILCLEPDQALAGRLRSATRTNEKITVCVGTIDTLSGTSFDSIVYVDVLEHIEDDKGELARAVRLLKTGGRVVVLAPAHQTLFSPFDTAIGHHRRYDRHNLIDCPPPSSRLEKLCYLDCVGLLASAANRLILRQRLPTRRQLVFWDTYLVPASKVMDPVFRYGVGRSILAVWRRTD